MLEQLKAEQILAITEIMMMVVMVVLLAVLVISKLLKRDTRKITYLLLIGIAGVLLCMSSLVFFSRALLAPIYISVIGIPAALMAIAIIITAMMVRKKQTS